MEFVCTTCCKEKREDAGLLPAAERYQSERIRTVLREGERLGKPALILSGKYGLLEPGEGIRWYDEALQAEKVEGLRPIVAEQLGRKGVTRLHFYARERGTPGWGPYYDLIEKACEAVGIPVVYHEVDGE